MLWFFRFALIQYQKALQGLRAFINGLRKGEGGRSTLICCMVLTLFDSFFGNVGFAAQHIHFGRKLLSAWMSTESEDIPPTLIMEDSVDCHLIRMFVTIDIQATSFLDIDKEYTYPNSLRIYRRQPVIPKKAQTLEETKRMTQQILFDGYNIYFRTLQYNSSLLEGIPQDLIHLREYYLSQINLWNSYLEGFARGEQHQDDVHPLSRSRGLRLHSTILLIRLSSAPNASESLYDGLLEQFEYLLSVSKEVIEFEARDVRLPSGNSSSYNPIL
jgi:hypothetical protein